MLGKFSERERMVHEAVAKRAHGYLNEIGHDGDKDLFTACVRECFSDMHKLDKLGRIDNVTMSELLGAIREWKPRRDITALVTDRASTKNHDNMFSAAVREYDDGRILVELEANKGMHAWMPDVKHNSMHIVLRDDDELRALQRTLRYMAEALEQYVKSPDGK